MHPVAFYSNPIAMTEVRLNPAASETQSLLAVSDPHHYSLLVGWFFHGVSSDRSSALQKGFKQQVNWVARNNKCLGLMVYFCVSESKASSFHRPLLKHLLIPLFQRYDHLTLWNVHETSYFLLPLISLSFCSLLKVIRHAASHVTEKL